VVTMRALVIGFGSIAQRHIASLRSLGVGDIAVFSPRGPTEDAPQNVRFMTDLDSALRLRPDIAIVASPSAAHIESLVPLLEVAIPCYVEKPPVTTMLDVERVRRLVMAKQPVTLTGCNLRFLPSLVRMREGVRSGMIGKPVRACLQAGQWLPDWRPRKDYRTGYSAKQSSGGGVILDLIHEIDAARWFFGDFDQVRCIHRKLSSLEIDADDAACLVLGRPEGPLVSVGLDYVARQRFRRYDIIGDQGTMTWDLAAHSLTLTTTQATETLVSGGKDFDVAETYRAAMAEFLASVRSGMPTSQDLLDGLASTELALQAICQ
jgi:predicted dehydrogenase